MDAAASAPLHNRRRLPQTGRASAYQVRFSPIPVGASLSNVLFHVRFIVRFIVRVVRPPHVHA